MLFNTTAYLVWTVLAAFAAVLTVFGLSPIRYRHTTLLVLSLAVYAALGGAALLGVLVAEAVVAWAVARAADRTEDDAARWRWALAGIGVLLAALVLVRIAASTKLQPSWWPPGARIASTIGVSYYTLQAISYVVDVYLGRSRAERSLGKVLTYLALFPKMIQGPIERASTLLPQLERPAIPGYEGLRAAAILFGWGLFKKMVLGDRLAEIANPAFADPSRYGGLATLLATYAFAFQLYFDFSGYTDMSRGAARFLGIELSENFRAPYLAPSISEFWRRWHMTFSRWLLDYVFTPLQAEWRRSPVAGTAAALFVTFSLSGLWHGFTGPFFVWGLLHGVYLAVESARRARRTSTPRATPARTLLGTVVTFHLVVLSWVFFRAPTLAVAGQVLGAVTRTAGGTGALVQAAGGPSAVALTLAACAAYAAVTIARDRAVVGRLWTHAPVRWAAYYSLVAAILLLRQGASTFIYAQF
jgi:D-alanyl-lipoteichoic acid acyltransferase DltB (MBOAT superfamily)